RSRRPALGGAGRARPLPVRLVPGHRAALPDRDDSAALLRHRRDPPAARLLRGRRPPDPAARSRAGPGPPEPLLLVGARADPERLGLPQRRRVAPLPRLGP